MAFSALCDGHPSEDVANAAANLIVNVVRQGCPQRAGAERAFDKLFGRAKALLMDHYDAAGRKKGIFPFDQVVNMRTFGPNGR